MNLSGILSIAGKPGLYKMVGQMKNGIVVESFEDGKRFPAYASNKVSALEDISIYGVEEDVPLGDVFQKIYDLEGGKASLSHNESADALRQRLEEAFPEFDEERVYSSDLKKVFKWYNLLLEKGALVPETENSQDEEETVAEEKSSSEPEAEKE